MSDSPVGRSVHPEHEGSSPRVVNAYSRMLQDKHAMSKVGRNGSFDSRNAARSLARKLALQALYRWQLNESPWQDVVQEFSAEEEMARADAEYFRELIAGVCAERSALDAQLASWMDRQPRELDPVEHAVLLIGAWELKARPEVPYRVVISEGVNLARRFGATDGHKFVNAVLDRAARSLRADEH